jgi:hypothetical protein
VCVIDLKKEQLRVDLDTDVKHFGVPKYVTVTGITLAACLAGMGAVLSGILFALTWPVAMFYLYRADPRGLLVWIKILRCQTDRVEATRRDHHHYLID